MKVISKRALIYGLIISLVITMSPWWAYAETNAPPESTEPTLPAEPPVTEEPLGDYQVVFSASNSIVYLDSLPVVEVRTVPDGQVVPASEYNVFYGVDDGSETDTYVKLDEVPKVVGTYAVCISDVEGGQYKIEPNYMDLEDGTVMFIDEPAPTFTINPINVTAASKVRVEFDGEADEKNRVEIQEGESVDLSKVNVFLDDKDLPKGEYNIEFKNEAGEMVTIIETTGRYTAVISMAVGNLNKNIVFEPDLKLEAEFQVVVLRPPAPPVIPDPWYPDIDIDPEPSVPEVPDVPDVPVIPEIPDVPEIPEVPEVKPEVPDEPAVPEVPDIKPDEPAKPIMPPVPKKMNIKTDYTVIGVKLAKLPRIYKGYRLAICQNGKPWRYIDSKNGYYNIKRLYHKPLVRNKVYSIKVAVLGDKRVVGKYSKVVHVYTNPIGQRSFVMKPAKLLKVFSKGRDVTVKAQRANGIKGATVSYRFAWREKGKTKWHYSRLTRNLVHEFTGFEEGKSYVMSLRYSYVSKVDGKTRVWSGYSRRLVKVK